MTEHSKEPWKIARIYLHEIIVGPNRRFAAYSVADAARIVACVNALAGLKPEEIPELVEAVEQALRSISLWKSTDKVGQEVARHLRAVLAKAKVAP